MPLKVQSAPLSKGENLRLVHLENVEIYSYSLWDPKVRIIDADQCIKGVFIYPFLTQKPSTALKSGYRHGVKNNMSA